MSLATVTLPTDPEELRAFAALLQSELYTKTLHIEKLKAQLATKLLNKYYHRVGILSTRRPQ